jgi:hypothetical protein
MIRAARIINAGIRGWRSSAEPFNWRNLTQSQRFAIIQRGAHSRGNAMRFAMVAGVGDDYESFEVLS